MPVVLNHFRIYTLYFTFSLILLSCRIEKDHQSETELLPSSNNELIQKNIVINESNTHLIFTFRNEKQEYQSVARIENIPQFARKQVIVTDLNLSPAERNASQVLYIADLTHKKIDGTYSYAQISRVNFEKPSQIKEKVSDNLRTSEGIIIYTTRWCGVCKKAKKFFKDQNISFIEKDIEGSQSAMMELSQKLSSHAMDFSGVPVIDIKGQLIVGFDEETLQSMLKK